MEPINVRTISFPCLSLVKLYGLNDFSTYSEFDISALCNQVIYQLYFEELSGLNSLILSCLQFFPPAESVLYLSPASFLYFNIIKIIEIKAVHI